MSSAYLNNQVSKTKAKKRAYEAFSIYLRTLWNQKGFVECYTCGAHTFLKAPRPGLRTTVGHWVEGHTNVSYINEVYVRPQCYHCNMMMGGNQGEFRDRIRKELGDKVVDELLIKAKVTVEISVSEYLQKQAYYKEKLSMLLQNGISSLDT
jgi:hypothetical protein